MSVADIPVNVHGTALVLGECGILVMGPSGSGKTTLALELIERFRSQGRFARLIGDDQLFVENQTGRLVCYAPPAICGLVEVHGLGVRHLPAERAAVIDLVVCLVPEKDMVRFPEAATKQLVGCQVSRIDVPAQNVIYALRIVKSWLEMPPLTVI